MAQLLSLDRPVVIAHRGGARLAPENTLAAFEHAVALGAHALECDVHLSRDLEPVVIHDATLERTTDARGPVGARTADELASVDAGFQFDPARGFPFRGRGASVPRLRDLLARCPDVPVVIEIKGADPRIAERVVDVARELGACRRVLVGAFDRGVLDVVRRSAPDIATSAGRDEVRSALRLSHVGLRPRRPAYRAFQVPCEHEGRRIVAPRFVRAARRARVPVHVWVVDEPVEMRALLAMGVTGLITDRPDAALAVAGE
jgi:glycerophosphoryl diester phosphodiesterase